MRGAAFMAEIERLKGLPTWRGLRFPKLVKPFKPVRRCTVQYGDKTVTIAVAPDDTAKIIGDKLEAALQTDARPATTTGTAEHVPDTGWQDWANHPVTGDITLDDQEMAPQKGVIWLCRRCARGLEALTIGALTKRMCARCNRLCHPSDVVPVWSWD